MSLAEIKRELFESKEVERFKGSHWETYREVNEQKMAQLIEAHEQVDHELRQKIGEWAKAKSMEAP